MAEKIKTNFAALNPVIRDYYVAPTEAVLRKDAAVIQWGNDNRYPDYLLSLYQDVGTLHSIIQGCVDYTLGNKIDVAEYTNSEGDTYEEVIRKITQDWFVFGGFAIQVIKNKLNETRELVHLPFQLVRSDEKNKVFYFSKDWSKSAGRIKYLVYPRYERNMEGSTGVIYVKNNFGSVYPSPLYGSKTTIQACEILKEISNFHYNQIQNGFMGGYSISFNDGEPDDKVKEEIENDVINKFTGTGNAGRVLINWARDKEHAIEVGKLETDDFADKYTALNKKIQSDLFSAFRATPNLFGLPSENLGFNGQEYQDMFKLFSRTVIRPVQQKIVDTFKVVGIDVSISPFTLE